MIFIGDTAREATSQESITSTSLTHGLFKLFKKIMNQSQSTLNFVPLEPELDTRSENAPHGRRLCPNVTNR